VPVRPDFRLQQVVVISLIIVGPDRGAFVNDPDVLPALDEVDVTAFQVNVDVPQGGLAGLDRALFHDCPNIDFFLGKHRVWHGNISAEKGKVRPVGDTLPDRSPASPSEKGRRQGSGSRPEYISRFGWKSGQAGEKKFHAPPELRSYNGRDRL